MKRAMRMVADRRARRKKTWTMDMAGISQRAGNLGPSSSIRFVWLERRVPTWSALLGGPISNSVFRTSRAASGVRTRLGGVCAVAVIVAEANALAVPGVLGVRRPRPGCDGIGTGESCTKSAQLICELGVSGGGKPARKPTPVGVSIIEEGGARLLEGGVEGGCLRPSSRGLDGGDLAR